MNIIMIGIAAAVAFNFFGPTGIIALGLFLFLSKKE